MRSAGDEPIGYARAYPPRMPSMLLSIIYSIVCFLTNLFLLRIRAGAAQDIELLALRHEVRVLRRQTKRPPWRAGDRLIFAALSRCLPRTSWSCFPVRPETLLRWHRELVRQKWAACGRCRHSGRPPLAAACRHLILRLARENPRWGYQRLRGELLKLGYPVSATTIRTVLRQHRVPPAPGRRGLAWRAFLGAQARAVLACDFFTVETVRLQTLYVLFFLQVGTRRVFLAGCTERPSADWVTLQARNLVWDLEDGGVEATLLIRDRDSKFTPAFDAVFSSHGVRVIRTPVRAPRANAFAERWVGTVRRECLDWVLILGQEHLEQVLREYVTHYNTARPHRALQLQPPLSSEVAISPSGPILR